jgi:hypothetical protein
LQENWEDNDEDAEKKEENAGELIFSLDYHNISTNRFGRIVLKLLKFRHNH